jgi:hypothetical protein
METVMRADAAACITGAEKNLVVELRISTHCL